MSCKTLLIWHYYLALAGSSAIELTGEMTVLPFNFFFLDSTKKFSKTILNQKKRKVAFLATLPFFDPFRRLWIASPEQMINQGIMQNVGHDSRPQASCCDEQNAQDETADQHIAVNHDLTLDTSCQMRRRKQNEGYRETAKRNQNGAMK